MSHTLFEDCLLTGIKVLLRLYYGSVKALSGKVRLRLYEGSFKALLREHPSAKAASWPVYIKLLRPDY